MDFFVMVFHPFVLNMREKDILSPYHISHELW